MKFETLFIGYIGLTTFVYPYLVLIFNYFSFTYLHFGVLLVLFFFGSVIGTLVTWKQETLHKYAGFIALLCGVVLLGYPFVTHHGLLIILQFCFGVCNGILRIVDREVIQKSWGSTADQRQIIRKQFMSMGFVTALGGAVGYFFDIRVVIMLSALLLIGAGILYSSKKGYIHDTP